MTTGRTPKWCLLCLLLVRTIRSSTVVTDAAESNIREEKSKTKLSPNEIDSIFVPPIPSNRKDRFPSREERVKLYMGSWYVPPCPGQALVTYKYVTAGNWTNVVVQDQTNKSVALEVANIIEPDKLFFVDSKVLLDCARTSEDGKELELLPTEERVKFRINLGMYCEDAVEILEVIRLTFVEQPRPLFPVLMQFGDMKHSHVFRMINFPHIKKFRSGTTAKEVERVTSSVGECLDLSQRQVMDTQHRAVQYSPILWKLATHRHYLPMDKVVRDDSIPYEEKKDMAVFRGQLTGSLESYKHDLSDAANCQAMMRCRLALEMAGSPYVDAKLTTTRKRLNDVIGGVQVTARPKMSIRRMLDYKIIIMLEGNDVASGLKWALLSSSVVLMPVPKHTSWAMEELLVPYKHYVPLKDDISDVEEKTKWIIDNPEKAKLISKHATTWMEDMEFHEESKRDEHLIKEEIVRRYQTHFRKVYE